MTEMTTLTRESELPSYANATERSQEGSLGSLSEKVFGLENNGRRWLSLFVKSRNIKSSSLPLFVEGDPISGHVELYLEKAENVKAVSIRVQGGTTFVGQEELRFLDETQGLWISVSNGVKATSKLKGTHSWPFSFTLPTSIPIEEPNGSKKMYSLPPNFSERASPAYIDYKLVVTIRRGMLRVNQTLSTSFGYYPITTPGPPSSLRQLAYRESSPLVGPDGDPEGWKVLLPVKVKGTLFNVKDVDIECSLAVATPLCYTIGSPIPLILTFSGEDVHALDVLASPSSIRLRLVRSIATGSDATEESCARRSDNYFFESVGQAYFWPSSEGAGEDHRKVLQGELEVARTLKPSFTFPRFTIRYTLELLHFQPVGFVSQHQEQDDILVSEQIQVATRQVPGIFPRSHAPPGYEKPHVVDYNKSVGLLENGNQRFYHHHPGW